MTRLSDYNAVPELHGKWRGSGVFSNNFLLPDGYKRLIAAGALYYESADGYLCFCEDRGAYRKLYFHCRIESPGNAPDYSPPGDKPMSADLTYRGGKISGGRAFLENAGFEPAVRFVRMTADKLVLPALKGDAPLVIRAGTESEAAALFEETFGAVPGDLPASGMYDDILVADDGGVVAGAIHCNLRGKTTHLIAVREEYRGAGVGTRLIARYRELAGDTAAPHKIWVAEENTGAIRLYRKLGYSPDGLSSQMFIAT